MATGDNVDCVNITNELIDDKIKEIYFMLSTDDYCKVNGPRRRFGNIASVEVTLLSRKASTTKEYTPYLTYAFVCDRFSA